jgi:tetratricopeptide (TPR) repeat protein
MYERGNGDCITTRNAELDPLYETYSLLGEKIVYSDNGGDLYRWTKAIPYFLKALAILEPWIAQIALSDIDRIDVLTEEQIEDLLEISSKTELSLSRGNIKLNNWDKSQHYYDQCVFHAKQLKEVEIKIKIVFDALSCQGNLYKAMNNLTEAKAIFEEAYMHISEANHPEHPLVLKAGDHLIDSLSLTGEFYDAERFARICYQSLTRPPLDPESYLVARACLNLAKVSCGLIRGNNSEVVDIEETEMLARKALQIMEKLIGFKSKDMEWSFNILADVLRLKKDLTDERENLLQDYLNDAIRYQGIDSSMTASAHNHFGDFHDEIA